ncbi:hypothetical protein [Nonomuraea dietziae]|uniref:Uncharacterized protein n=1 Tax=Nonomuraea dietziae TaxID=65515 RepID=A0A7W5YB29_9ACTN|nr:hypothetical protein [Nonomuraea dietziae]MBB3731553.1 hypothetical protein [Nonomuraea dietziae]
MNDNKNRTIRRLRDAALFSAVRAISAAAGSALVGAVIWWLQNR